MKTALLIVALVAIGCTPPATSSTSTGGSTASTAPATPSGFTLTSSTFQERGAIPPGGKIPDLHWSGLPSGTKALALEVTDPDASNFVHWIVLDIDPSGTPDKGVSGKNGSGGTGYYPPEPPPGETHHYHFKLIAIDDFLKYDDDFDIDKLNSYLQGHILGTTELVGTYKSP